jgi:3-oxoacyl-[acyl-carrier-protein] synthase II
MMAAAVTGWAARTPLGGSIDQLAMRLLAGERAARLNTRFPSGTYACRLAAPIPDDPRRSPHGRVLRRMGLFALEVGHEALADAGCGRGPRLGLFAAMGGLRAHWNDIMPALARQTPDLADSWNRGFKDLHPFWMLQHLSNNAHALLAQDVDARGEGVTFSGSNAGAQALAAAARALEAGAVDAALVIAYDSLIEPETIVEMAARGALATCDVDDLRAPYDERANGMVPGEAAAALVLERSDRAAAHRTWSYLAAADGGDGQEGEPRIETVARAAARVARGDRIVDGCCLARPSFDAAEARALAEVLAAPVRLTAIQGATGLLGAAAALVQAIALSTLLRWGALPPLAGPRGSARALAGRSGAGAIEETSAIGLCAGAPGLVGAVRVSIQGATRFPVAPAAGR